MQIVISDNDGKSYKLELPNDKEAYLVGKSIGDKLLGDPVGCEGYVFLITGGSDKTGTPMRSDLEGTDRKSIILYNGQGIRPKGKGYRARKSVRGRTVSPDIVQVNCTVVQKGQKPLSEIIPKSEKKDDKKK